MNKAFCKQIRVLVSNAAIFTGYLQAILGGFFAWISLNLKNADSYLSALPGKC